MKKNPLFIIFLTVLIDLIGFGIIIPMSPYLARNFGASPFEVGLLMAIFSGMQFLFSPFWGGLSDRWGRRPILLISILGTTLAHGLFYVSSDLFFLFFARFLAGVFSANISTAAAVIADVTDSKNRSKNMGLIGAAIGMGFVIGPALGGVFEVFGENAPALVATAASAINFVFAGLMLPETLARENRRVRQRVSRIKHIYTSIRRPVIGVLLSAQFVMGFAMANMEAALFLFVNDRFHWGLQKASFGFAYVGVCIALTQGVLVRRLLPKWGERRIAIWGLLLFALSFFLISISQWIWLLAVAMTALALGNGFAHPSLNGSLSLLTPANEQGEIMGVSQSMQALARVIGPPVGGYIYAQVGITSPFLLAGTLATVAFLAIISSRKQIPNASQADV